MPEFPALPLWTDAYLADTKHLTDEEHGLYLQLLMLIWRTPGCRIPNDDTWIAARFPGKPRQKLIKKLLDEFCICGKWIRQKRLTREKRYLVKYRVKMVKMAKARWDKEKDLCYSNAPTPIPIGIVRKKEATNGNVIGIGKHRVKPKHGQITKDRLRIWLDANTTEFTAYSVDYWNKHHTPPPLQWDESGAWFNQLGET